MPSALAGFVARFDPGLSNVREAAVTMAATLGSFATALAIEHAAALSTSIVILAVALTLSVGRLGPRADHRTIRGVALAAVVLPLVAIAANEIGTRIFRQPDLGDALFVLAMSTTIWLRRFGPTARQIATFATFPLIAMLIVPAPIVADNGSTNGGRWWAALVALVALAWVTATRFIAERSGILATTPTHAAPTSPRPSSARAGRRIASSTKMALQLAAALGAGFAVGRSLFGMHWTWVVLTAFIVCSGNRGRGDVVHKAALRLTGAAAGTAAATALSSAFAPSDPWSIAAIFAVLTAALWLRPINYAYWAAGMTAALALLYGYYGERGVGLLGTRLEAILVGAALAVAASWLLLPVRTTDVLRRDIAAALMALDDYLAGLHDDPSTTLARQDRFRHAVSTLAHASALQRMVPTRFRSSFDHLPAVHALEHCAAELPTLTAALAGLSPKTDRREHLDHLQASIGSLRQSNAQRLPPDPRAWTHLADAVRELPQTLNSPTPTPRAAPSRIWAASQKILAHANRVHATTYQLVAELSHAGTSITYLVEDASGQQAHLTWNRDSSLAQISPIAQTELGERTPGRTPSGYPYRLTTI